MPLCQLMIFAAGAFGEDHEYFSGFELGFGGAQRLAVSLAALDGERAHQTHQPANFAVK